MPLLRETPPFPDEPIWRWILIVLVASTTASVLIMLGATYLWDNPLLADVAGWSALMTAGFYLFFRWLGAREARRRREREGREREGG